MNTRRIVAVTLGLLLMVMGLGTAPVSADKVSSSGFSARGIPLQGQVLFGSASGNSAQNPLPREATVGGAFGIHRTYWRGNQQSAAMARARDDLANGRLPWLSFKTPYGPSTSTPLSWEAMVAGAGDVWARDLAVQLSTLPGPVWVAVHHEPEGDGDEQAWKRMQQRLSPIFRAHPNIAFTVILMGYHQFGAPTIDPTKSISALYPGDQFVDVMGFDPYNFYGTTKSNGTTSTTFTELKTYYSKIASWAASAGGVKWAISETGFTDLAADRDAAWLTRAYDDMKRAGGIALTYWDNQGFKSPSNTFALSTPAKQAEFAKVLARSDRLTGSPVAAPAAPKSLTATASGTSTVKLTWSTVPGATSYTLHRGPTQIATTANTTYTDTDLTPDTTYTYTLTATNAGGTSPTTPTTVTTRRPVAFRAANTATGNATKASVTIPSQVQAGDSLMLFVSTNTGVSPAGTATGWNPAGDRVGRTLRTVLWTRVATTTDAGAAVQVSFPKISKFDLTLIAYSGVTSAKTVPVVASAAETVATAQHKTPAVTLPQTQSIVLSFWVDKSSTGTGWKLPNGQTRRTQANGTGNGRLTSVSSDSVAPASSQKSTPISATSSAATSKATMWTVALSGQ